MDKIVTEVEPLDDQVGCVGDYDATDDVCSKCALKLRCIIEYHQNVRMEFIEDIVASNSTFIKTQ
ncbi:MAG: hypothetical protein JRI64_02990 [Deltaproteobacteria bacterium]|nr:hypothetical protein [Deltaproteobacteria bacterium]